MTSSYKESEIYNIAGYRIRFQGHQGVEMLRNMKAFQPFFCKSGEYDWCINLDEETREANFESLYKFEFEAIECNYGRNGKYIFLTMQVIGDKNDNLVLKYENELKISISSTSNPTLLRFAIWTAINIAGTSHQTIAMHSSCIEHNGKAILFIGESGAGKSTHTKLWYNNLKNTQLLNDDSPLVRIENDNKIYAYGSPWSGKTPCYKNLKVEIAAIVRLEKGDRNILKRNDAINSVVSISKSIPPFISIDNSFSEHKMGLVSKLANDVPVYTFHCLPDLSAVTAIKHELFGDERIVIDNKLVFSEIIKRIEKGETVSIAMHGTSMRPLIDNGDMITLSPVKSADNLRKQDVVLFLYNGKHLLHRIIKIDKNTIYLRGDSSAKIESVEKKDIYAILSRIEKSNGETIDCDSIQWKAKSHFVLTKRLVKNTLKKIANG